MAAVFGEHDPRPYRARSAVYAKAKNAYEKAIASSEAQRAKDEALALATFYATNEVLSATCTDPDVLRDALELRPRDET